MRVGSIFIISGVLLSLAVLPVFGQMTHVGREMALVGEVTKLSSGSISLTQRSGGILDLTTDSKTTVSGRKEVTTVSQIKVGNLVAAISTTSGQATASAKRLAQKLFVRVASPSASETKRLVTGVVTGINASQITLLQKNEIETFYNLSASSSAVIKGKGEAAGTASILLGQRVAVVGTVDEGNTVTPLLIYILSEKP